MLMKNIFLNLKIKKFINNDLRDTLLHAKQITKINVTHGVPLI